MRKRILLSLDELRALREAVRAIPWMPMDLAGYRAVQSVGLKLDAALAATERRARQADRTSAPPG